MRSARALALGLLLLVACAESPADREARVSLRVEGFVQAAGIT